MNGNQTPYKCFVIMNARRTETIHKIRPGGRPVYEGVPYLFDSSVKATQYISSNGGDPRCFRICFVERMILIPEEHLGCDMPLEIINKPNSSDKNYKRSTWGDRV